MKVQQYWSKLYSATAWAMFMLGTTQLALVLGGMAYSLIAMFCCANLFAFFSFKVADRKNEIRKKIVKPYLFTTAIFIVANALYVCFVFVKPEVSDIIFLSVCIVFSIVPVLIISPFLRKSSNAS